MTKNICDDIITDMEWVWQMLLNLLTNACKHTDEGSIHVNISVCKEYPTGRKFTKNTTATGARRSLSSSSSSNSDPQEQLLFQIVDTGIGLDPGRHNSLFEVFSQAQSGQSTGTGLGLFSVFCRCEKLGGACGAHSSVDKEGCTFWFFVPYLPTSKQYVRAADFTRYTPPLHKLCSNCQPDGMVVMGIGITWDDSQQQQQQQYEHIRSSLKASGMVQRHDFSSSSSEGERDDNICLPYTAFVVDDVQSIRKLLKKSLLALGFTHVEVFENGKRALDAMKKEVVDVVLMDIQVIIM
jgi:hypothetical protein